MTSAFDPTTGLPLPADDPALFAEGQDIDALARHWRAQSELSPMTGSEMRGADAKAQRLGAPAEWLMEHAGTAVAAAARALMIQADRSPKSLVLLLCGPGNNGGDGLVAARVLAAHGIASEVVLLGGGDGPTGAEARLNWQRLDGVEGVHSVVTSRASDVALYFNGIERAGLVVDALLGTGVSGVLRDPVRTAVDVAVRARENLVPLLAVDTPTSVDLNTGEPSDPVVRADVTVTFHRPKLGHEHKIARLLSGRRLVAPIGIPTLADRT
jgi:hydroxyethylthiazole kinase-like uncharacterized protein yjeF